MLMSLHHIQIDNLELIMVEHILLSVIAVAIHQEIPIKLNYFCFYFITRSLIEITCQ